MIDLLSQVEINSVGGLYNWLPSKIIYSEKIIVVLTKDYLKVCRDNVICILYDLDRLFLMSASIKSCANVRT